MASLSSCHFALSVFASFSIAVCAGSNILLLGDSNAAYAGPSEARSVNTLQTACAGSTVVNQGVSGSTATEWNGGSDLTDAFAEGSGWTHVWVTLGANDLSLDCSLTKAAIKGRLETTVSLIKAIQSDINIVFTGYCIAAVDESCGLSAYYDKVAVAQREIAAADSAVTFVCRQCRNMWGHNRPNQQR